MGGNQTRLTHAYYWSLAARQHPHSRRRWWSVGRLGCVAAGAGARLADSLRTSGDPRMQYEHDHQRVRDGTPEL